MWHSYASKSHAFDLFENEELKHQKHIKVAAINQFFERLISLTHGADIKVIVLQVDKQHYRDKVERCAAQ